MLPSEIVRNERGADVCHRIVKVAVHNVEGDDSKGFHYEERYCNRPVFLNISENQKECPSCDRRPPVGNVHPRTTNAAGIKLTQKELEECGVKRDISVDKVERPKKLKEAKKAVEAKVKVRKDELSISVSLGDLESNGDLAALLIERASKALDSLPVTNFAESKRLIKLQEKLDSLLKI